MQTATFICFVIILFILCEAEAVALSFDLQGKSGEGYGIIGEFGTPLQSFLLLFDTGSSNLAVAGYNFGANATWYAPGNSSTAKSLKQQLTLQYVKGRWSGAMFSDVFRFSSAADSKSTMSSLRTRFAVIQNSTQFFPSLANPPWQGIVGMAYSAISAQSTADQPETRAYRWQQWWAHMTAKPSERTTLDTNILRPIHSVLDDMVETLSISDGFFVQLCGSTEVLKKVATGEVPSSHLHFRQLPNIGRVTIGEQDSASASPSDVPKFFYTKVISKRFFQVTLAGISINGKSVIQNCKLLNTHKTVLDTGTISIFLSPVLLRSVILEIQAHVNKTGRLASIHISEAFWIQRTLLCHPLSKVFPSTTGLPYSIFPSIYFDMPTLDGNPARHILKLRLSPQQYLRYIGRVTTSRGTMDCFIFGFQESADATILGTAFLEGFHVHFDRAGGRIGFANSTCANYTDVGSLGSSVIGITSWRASSMAQEPRDCHSASFMTSWVSMAPEPAVMLVCLLLSCFLLLMSILLWVLYCKGKLCCKAKANNNEPSLSDSRQTITDYGATS